MSRLKKKNNLLINFSHNEETKYQKNINKVSRASIFFIICIIRSFASSIYFSSSFQLPYKHEFVLNKQCMATVGKLSHAEIKEKQFGSAQMHRRFGYKMSSGLWHKKDGYCGRKVRRPPPPRM